VPRYYPAYLDIKDKKCLVSGGGAVAERKVGLLINCEAHICVVSPDLTPGLEELNVRGQIEYIRGEFKEEYLEGLFLVVGATDKKETNIRIYTEAVKRGILVNIADSPELCSFLVPSVVERGDLIISISTCGKSPALAKKIREELEDRYGIEYAEFLSIMGKLRDKIPIKILDKNKREEVYKKLVYSPIIDLIKDGKNESVRTMIDEIINPKNAFEK
jgi:precorrin-2 dehydrogenase/sirohydrochlorin ferrochelatase